MTKGIIVVDVPEHCRDCNYFGTLCKITNKKCHYYNKKGRPDWCPIYPFKQLPLHMRKKEK